MMILPQRSSCSSFAQSSITPTTTTSAGRQPNNKKQHSSATLIFSKRLPKAFLLEHDVAVERRRIFGNDAASCRSLASSSFDNNNDNDHINRTSSTDTGKSIEEMEVKWMRQRTEELLHVSTGEYSPDTWLAADDLLKWWASQGTVESVTTSFQILDRVIDELRIHTKSTTANDDDDYNHAEQGGTVSTTMAYLDPSVVVTMLSNWYNVWEEEAAARKGGDTDATGVGVSKSSKDKLIPPPLELTPEMLLDRMDSYARDLPGTNPIFMPGKAISYLFNARLLCPEPASRSAPFCDYLIDRLMEVIPAHDSISVYMVNTTMDLWAKSHLPNRIERAEDLFARAIDNKVELDVITYNTLLSVYANAGLGTKAERLLQALLQEHLDDKNSGRNNNDFNEAAAPAPDKISFHTVGLAYANSGQGLEAAEQALFLVQRMMDPFDDYGCLGIEVTNVMFNTVISAFARSGHPQAGDRAYQVLLDMKKTDFVSPDAISYGSVIDAYSRNGQPRMAEKVFEEQVAEYMKNKDDSLRPNTLTMTLLIVAWSKAKLPNAAVQAHNLLERMLDLRSRQILLHDPDTWAFNAVLDCVLSSSSSDTEKTIFEANRFLSFMKERAKSGYSNAWPNSWTYSQLVLFCLDKKKHKHAETFLREAHADPRIEMDIRTTGRATIDWAKQGWMQTADFFLHDLLDRCEENKGKQGTRPSTSLLGAVAAGWARSVEKDTTAVDRLQTLVKRYEGLHGKGFLSSGPDGMVYSILVSSLVKKRAALDALETLQKMREAAMKDDARAEMMPDTTLYRQVLRGLVNEGKAETASDLLQQMVEDFQLSPTQFPAPDTGCFVQALRGLSESDLPGTWERAVYFFNLMIDPPMSSETVQVRRSKNPIRDRRVFGFMIRIAKKLSLKKEAHDLWQHSQKWY